MKRLSALIPLVLLVAIAPAFAQPASVQAGGVIDIGQAFSTALAPYVNAIVQALIVAGLGWLTLKLQQKTGIQIDAGHRDAIAKALQNQAGALIAAGAVRLDGVKVNVSSAALAKAANDLLASMPDAAKHFGLTPDYVASKIVATIPQTTAGAQMIAQAQPPASA